MRFLLRSARRAVADADPTAIWGALAHLEWLLHQRLSCRVERAARRRGGYGYPKGVGGHGYPYPKGDR